jgi:predicted O-linked N-acetylglucosamine transferase (SPINDLY family)
MTDPSMDEALQLHDAGKLREAEAIYRRVLQQEPANAVALHMLGVLAVETGHPIEAEKLVRRAVTLRPDYANAQCNLALILNILNRHADAIAPAKRAVELSPRSADAHQNLGFALMGSGELHAAVLSFEAALTIDPNHLHALTNLATAMLLNGGISEAVELYRRAVDLAPRDVRLHDDLVFFMQFDPRCDAAQIRVELRRWWERHGAPLPRPSSYANDRDTLRKLRIGYVSPHFRDHVVGFNVLPLLERHDRSQFEITLYSNHPERSKTAARFLAVADRWRDIVAMNDEQVAGQIRDDGIDILVDLALHMPGNRLPIFARQPAPLQISFAAYPASAGLETIQYRFTDGMLDPVSDDGLYLPSFWCYQPTGDEPAVNVSPALQSGVITFGCLSDSRKINDEVLRLWAQVMREVPASRLVLLLEKGHGTKRVIDVLARESIDSSRVQWLPFTIRPSYLAYYHELDLMLDTLPYNAHTTALDAAWMGVPTVTLIGQSSVGRAGLSQLTNLGLTELAAKDAEEFVRIAVELANHRPRLAKLRASLRERMQKSPICDAAGIARAMETNYREIWRRWCEQTR